VVFDPHVKPHHHFIDEDPAKVIDRSWEALSIRGEKSVEGFEAREYRWQCAAEGSSTAFFARLGIFKAGK
jgi:hypothetical protein